MPLMINDFQDIPEKCRKALCLYVKYDGDYLKALREAGYQGEDRNMKQTWKRLTKLGHNIKYLNQVQSNPQLLEEELDWFYRLHNQVQPIPNKVYIEVAKNLTPENRTYLEQYFLHGNRLKAMMEAGFKGDEDTLRKKASAIMRNQTSIEYMTLLNDRSLQELFLSKSKIIKEVYELAKECKDSKSRFAAVKAYELLGRMVGLLNEKSNVQIQDGGKIEINYIVPDKIDTRLQEDINKFIDDNKNNTFTDVEFDQYDKDGGRKLDDDDVNSFLKS